MNVTLSLNFVVEPPQVAELDVWLAGVVSKSGVPSLTNDACGELASARYSRSTHISESRGTAPPPQMHSMVAVLAEPVVSFQMAIGGVSNGIE